MWTLHGSKATIYLLGSIHVLPPQMVWRTPAIDAALQAADTFVFEIPDGCVPESRNPGVCEEERPAAGRDGLPSLLDADARKDYVAALDLTHVPPEQLTPMRPWLALLLLNAGLVTATAAARSTRDSTGKSMRSR